MITYFDETQIKREFRKKCNDNRNIIDTESHRILEIF